MIVVADTSCICYLILLDCIELLPQMYGGYINSTMCTLQYK